MNGHVKRRSISKGYTGSPLIKASYSTSHHGTPVISIRLDGTPRQRYRPFSPALPSPVSDEDELPALPAAQIVNEIPLVPFATPQFNHRRTWSVPYNKQSPRLRSFRTLSEWLWDLKLVLESKVNRQRGVKRAQTWLLLLGTIAVFILVINVILSVPGSMQVVNHHARMRSLLSEQPINDETPILHFAGLSYHPGRDPVTKGKAAVEPLKKEAVVATGTPKARKAPQPAVPRRASVAQQAKEANQKLALIAEEVGQRNAQAASEQVLRRLNLEPRLAGGLPFPGIIEARKAAAQAYKTALSRPGVSDRARQEAHKVIQEASRTTGLMLPTHAAAPKTLFEVFDEPVAEPQLSEADLRDTPELEEKAQLKEEAAAKELRRKALPLRLQRFGGKGFQGEMP